MKKDRLCGPSQEDDEMTDKLARFTIGCGRSD